LPDVCTEVRRHWHLQPPLPCQKSVPKYDDTGTSAYFRQCFRASNCSSRHHHLTWRQPPPSDHSSAPTPHPAANVRTTPRRPALQRVAEQHRTVFPTGGGTWSQVRSVSPTRTDEEKRTAPTTVSKGEVGGRRERVGVGCVCVREVEGCDEEEKTMRSDDRGKIETRKELSESVVSTDRVRTHLWGNSCSFSLGPMQRLYDLFGLTHHRPRPPFPISVCTTGRWNFSTIRIAPMQCHVKCNAPGPER
jgi:hypothetical protein